MTRSLFGFNTRFCSQLRIVDFKSGFTFDTYVLKKIVQAYFTFIATYGVEALGFTVSQNDSLAVFRLSDVLDKF